MNYYIHLDVYGYTFKQIVRITSRLARRTGRARLAWTNRKGGAHIIAEGAGGYQQTPQHGSVDWQRGGIVECTPNFVQQ